MTDTYEGFAERYDLFPHAPEAAAFYRRLFAKHAVSRVLDCACGTGRDLVMFHALGCEVVGADLSPSMLAAARKNVAKAGIDVPLHEADYGALATHFERDFDAVVCLSGALLECADEAQMLQALRSMQAVLRPDGLLVLTQGTTDKLWREKPRFILAANSPAVSRVFAIDYLDRGARFNILDIYHSPDKSGLEVWSMLQPTILFSADYERLLHEADFSEVQFFGSYRFDQYDPETSQRLIVVARK